LSLSSLLSRPSRSLDRALARALSLSLSLSFSSSPLFVSSSPSPIRLSAPSLCFPSRSLSPFFQKRAFLCLFLFLPVCLSLLLSHLSAFSQVPVIMKRILGTTPPQFLPAIQQQLVQLLEKRLDAQEKAGSQQLTALLRAFVMVSFVLPPPLFSLLF